jgi:hypothetical protein
VRGGAAANGVRGSDCRGRPLAFRSIVSRSLSRRGLSSVATVCNPVSKCWCDEPNLRRFQKSSLKSRSRRRNRGDRTSEIPVSMKRSDRCIRRRSRSPTRRFAQPTRARSTKEALHEVSPEPNGSRARKAARSFEARLHSRSRLARLRNVAPRSEEFARGALLQLGRDLVQSFLTVSQVLAVRENDTLSGQQKCHTSLGVADRLFSLLVLVSSCLFWRSPRGR